MEPLKALLRRKAPKEKARKTKAHLNAVSASIISSL
jgi:hypothetical protein